jgi:hypothetical protein
VANVIYELPFGGGSHFGGWQISAVGSIKRRYSSGLATRPIVFAALIGLSLGVLNQCLSHTEVSVSSKLAAIVCHPLNLRTFRQSFS